MRTLLRISAALALAMVVAQATAADKPLKATSAQPAAAATKPLTAAPAPAVKLQPSQPEPLINEAPPQHPAAVTVVEKTAETKPSLLEAIQPMAKATEGNTARIKEVFDAFTKKDAEKDAAIKKLSEELANAQSKLERLEAAPADLKKDLERRFAPHSEVKDLENRQGKAENEIMSLGQQLRAFIKNASLVSAAKADEKKEESKTASPAPVGAAPARATTSEEPKTNPPSALGEPRVVRTIPTTKQVEPMRVAPTKAELVDRAQEYYDIAARIFDRCPKSVTQNRDVWPRPGVTLGTLEQFLDANCPAKAVPDPQVTTRAEQRDQVASLPNCGRGMHFDRNRGMCMFD